jgi:fatty-acyl-CoA synthase
MVTPWSIISFWTVGASFDAPTVQKLMIDHGVTIAAGVPTVWLGLLGHLKANGGGVGKLCRLFIGGSAAPPAMIDAFEDMGVEVRHCWGMTEMSPLGAISAMTSRTSKLPVAEQRALKAKQGRPPFGVEMRIVDDAGVDLPRDGAAFGRLLVRGPWIVDTYFGHESPSTDAEGWFDTGDVATIDPDGFMQIVDRSKDVIKSGGEWISSIEIENLAVGLEGVAEAAVIGVAHPKWDERPLLVVVRRPGAEVTREAMLRYLDGRIAKWWMPDDVVFVDELPHTATGKIQKVTLREQFRDYRLPTAA